MDAFVNRGGSKRAAPAVTNAPKNAPPEPSLAAASAGLSGLTAEETKRLRSDRADQIKRLTLQDFLAQKGPLKEELASLRGVECGWCHEAGGVLRTKDQHIYEVRREGQHGKRAVAWTYVTGVSGAALHTVVCLLCFGEVFRFKKVLSSFLPFYIYLILIRRRDVVLLPRSSQCRTLVRSFDIFSSKAGARVRRSVKKKYWRIWLLSHLTTQPATK